MDETLVGLYRKALNRHLKGDLLYFCLDAVDTGLNGSQMLPSAIMTRFPGTIKEKMKLWADLSSGHSANMQTQKKHKTREKNQNKAASMQ